MFISGPASRVRGLILRVALPNYAASSISNSRRNWSKVVTAQIVCESPPSTDNNKMLSAAVRASSD